MPTSASIASSTRFAWKQPSGKLPFHCATFKMEYSAWYRQASIPEATNTAEFAGSMRHTPKSCVQRECLRVSFKIRAVNPSEPLVAGCLRQRMDGRRVGDRIRVHPGLKQQKRTAEFSADVSCHAVSRWASCICDSHRFACRWPSLMPCKTSLVFPRIPSTVSPAKATRRTDQREAASHLRKLLSKSNICFLTWLRDFLTKPCQSF